MITNSNPFANNPGDLLARALVLWLTVDELVRTIKDAWPHAPIRETIEQRMSAVSLCFTDLETAALNMDAPPPPPRQDIYPGPVDNRWKTCL